MGSHPCSAFLLVLGITTLLGTHGCAEKRTQEAQERTVYKMPAEPPQAPAGNLETPPPAETEDTIAAALKAKEEFQQTLAENLRRLDEQMRELQLKVANLSERAQADWSEKMEELDAKRKAAQAKLAELRAATGEAWEHLREGSRAAWKELEEALEKAAAAF